MNRYGRLTALLELPAARGRLGTDEVAVVGLAAHAERVVVVAHSSKLGRRALAKICGTDQVDVLITDTAATDQAVEPYLERGVEVQRV